MTVHINGQEPAAGDAIHLDELKNALLTVTGLSVVENVERFRLEFDFTAGTYSFNVNYHNA